MQITLFMAMSVNGMIARPDYREDFLSQHNWTSFLQEARRSGAVIWGRKTHDKVRQWGSKYFSDETYGIYNFNWGYYLNSMKLLCEKGAGTPFVPPK